MSRWRRRATSLTVLLAVLLIDSSCGGGTTEPVQPPPPPPPPGPTPPPPPPAPGAERLAFTESPDSGNVGLYLPKFVVSVLDSAGNVVTGSRDTVTVSIAENPSGGALSGTIRVAAVNGIATFGALAIDKVGIGYRLRATARGLDDAASFVFRVAHGMPSRLEFRPITGRLTSQELIAPGIAVEVRDVGGNLVENATDSVILSLRSNPVNGVLTGSLGVRAVRGVATFLNLRIDKPDTRYTLLARSGGLGIGESDTIRIGPPVASALRFVTSTGNSVSGFAVPVFELEALNSDGQRLKFWNDTVSVSLGANPTGATLSGTLQVTAKDGLARFDEVIVDRLGSGYQLVAAAGALRSSESAAFQVTAPIPGRQDLISVNGMVSCGIVSSGSTTCWGRNFTGELGNGRLLWSADPVPVSGGLAFKAITVGGGFACGNTQDDRTYCWGNNGYGALGDGTREYRRGPVPVGGGLTFTEVAASYGAVCARSADAGIYCWGAIYDSHDGPPPPVQMTPAARYSQYSFSALSAGSYVYCGLRTDSTALCWNWYDGGFVVGGGLDLRFSAVVAGSSRSCGIGTDNAAYCWGWSSDYGDPIGRVGGDVRFTKLSVGSGFICGLDAGGQAWCWGDGSYGVLGNGATGNTSIPTRVSGGHTFVEMNGKGSHTCGITGAGNVWCWGYNGHGQLGDGTRTDRSTPVLAAGGRTFVAVATNGANTCALDASGSAWCWGDNTSGALGDGDVPVQSTPQFLAGNHNFAMISIGGPGGCGLTPNGELRCWGDGAQGRLGNGSSAPRSAPVTIAPGRVFTTVSVGDQHSCALTDMGDAYCWGGNKDGQLGAVSSGDSSMVPVAVTGGHRFASISVSRADDWNRDYQRIGHTCALDTNGAAWCWGYNGWGQLGDSTNTSRSAPVRVAGNHRFRTIHTSERTTCGLTPGGATWCWGYDGGSRGPQRLNMPQLAALSMSSGSMCGLTPAGEAWCLGNNEDGQLGDGAPDYHVWQPVRVAGGHVFSALSMGSRHACGVTTDGTAHCWGTNGNGQLGTGTFTSSSTPVAVSGGHVFKTGPQSAASILAVR